MKRLLAICASVMLVALAVSAQNLLPNRTMQERIGSAHAEKSIALTFDAPTKMSKIMAVSENFSKDEASRSGILAMNFAIGLFYPEEALVKSPDSFLFTFWALSKKPRFGSNHAMTVTLRDEILVIGSARYTGKPREQMEYLNFEISRENLARIAGQTDVSFQLGDQQFTFTRSQIKLLADLLVVTEVN